MVWTVQYEANELPENATPAWTTNYSPDPLEVSTVEISPAGILHVVGEGVAGEGITWSQEPAFVDAVGVTLEFRMQMVTGDLMASASGEHYITFYTDNTPDVVFKLYTDGIVDPDGSYAFDTTDDYHTYRITCKDHVVKLYVDGVLRREFTKVAGAEGAYLEFTITNGSNDSEQNWDYIYYSTDGAFAPEVAETGSNSALYYFL